jgi:glutathione S-transferase
MAPHIVLEEIGVDYEIQLVDIDTGEHKSENFLKVNPYGRVPALLLEDGRAVSESAGIAMYLADQYPQAGLAPTITDPERPFYNQWLFFFASMLYQTYTRHNRSHRFSTDPADAPKIRERACQDLLHWWQVIDERLEARPWLLGDRFSTCDIYMYMLTLWHVPRELFDPNISTLPSEQFFDRFPHVKRTAAAVAERPAVQKITDLYPQKIYEKPTPYK